MIRVFLACALIFTTTAAEARNYRQHFRPVQQSYASQYQARMRQQGISAQRQMKMQYARAYQQSMRGARIR